MTADLASGDRIRPYVAIHYGTAGCFGRDKTGAVFLLTCDHVVKTLTVPETGPWKIYFPLDHSFRNKIALFEGKSLVKAQKAIADVAAVRTLLEIPDPSLLPEP